MFIVDAHLDLSMNAMEWNRDLRLSLDEINQRELGMKDKPDRSKATVSLPELRKGNIGLVFATQIARFVDLDNPLPGWNSPEQAWAQTQGQLAWYKSMEEEGELVQILDLEGLERHLENWQKNSASTKKAIGYVLTLEGADSILSPGHLEKSYLMGLRALGPAHYGRGRYAYGTDSEGKFSSEGHKLLKEMERLGIILDTTHLSDESFWDALRHFEGFIWASHSNCRSLVEHNRQFKDDQILELINRGAVIGSALDAWMLVPNWIRGKSLPKEMDCHLGRVVEQMDHICQISGNSLHVGLGSDLDGAFGREQCPYDLERISDLQKFEDLLTNRGYSTMDIENILHANWLNFLKKAWSK